MLIGAVVDRTTAVETCKESRSEFQPPLRVAESRNARADRVMVPTPHFTDRETEAREGR